MSIVCCRVGNLGYTIAADSITVRGYTQRKGDDSRFSKLTEVNNLIIGGVGIAEETSLLCLFARTRRPSEAEEWAVVDWLSEFAEWKQKKINKPGLENHYLLGIERKVFSVMGWHVAEVSCYEAIGAGMDFALGALVLGNSAITAVETAIKLCIYCEGPVQKINRVFDLQEKP